MANELGLDAVTTSLRNRGVKGSLAVVNGRLFWRCTCTDADGIRKSRRVALGLPADPAQLIEADSRVVALAADIRRTGLLPDPLPWEIPTPDPSGPGGGRSARITVGEAITELELDFWRGKVRTGAAERTWARIRDELKRLPPKATLTMDLLVARASSTSAGSRSRQEACKVYKRLAKFVGLAETERLDAIKSPYEPGQREIPSDQELEGLLLGLDRTDRYAWMTWALVTYGCRPSEVFSLLPSEDGTARVLTVKRKDRQPTWRTAMALPLVEELQERSVPWDVASPAQYDSLEALRIISTWGKWLKRRAPGLKLYDIRHSWAIRSIRQAIPTALAAKCMGHDIAVHSRTYHRWLEQADVAAFVGSRGDAAS